MCGIIGFNWEDKVLARRMADLLKHRGPDDYGFYFDKNISLGHRRLSIIDLSEKGRNPIFNEKKDVCVVYNGEIYNFQELKKGLEKKGHKFYSDTDSEVIVHAYEEYGLDFVKHFNGIFGFALYDMQKKLLILARDRLGVKPLHYYHDGKRLIFASEIKSILLHDIERKLNPDALNKFLHFNYILGEDTMFQGIKKLPPGFLLIYDFMKKGLQLKQYWDIEIKQDNKTEDYFAKELAHRLKQAVKSQLISDVPLGLFLSGGIDSTTILALMKELGQDKIKTYAVGFNEPWDEVHDARKVSEQYGTDHHEIFVESDVLKHYPEFVWHMDSPKTNLSPQYYVSQLAKKTVTVALTGLGGDELFGGYRRHKYYCLQKRLSTIPKFVAKPVFGSLSKLAFTNYQKRGLKYLADIHNKAKAYTLGVPLLIFDEDRKKLMKGKMLKQPDSYVEPYFKNSLNYYDQCLRMEAKTYLADDLLERMDRMSMANSIEARVPFLDHTFVEFAFSIPSRLKRFDLGQKAGKYLLIKAMQKKIPKFVIEKRKTGFNMSPYYWFKGSMREHAQNILTQDVVNRRGLFNYDFIKKIIEKKPTEAYYYNYQTLWNLMLLEVWHQMYLDDESLKPKKNIEDYYSK